MGILSKIFGETRKVQPVPVTDATFEEEVVRSKLPVVLDIWSPTCAHCKKLEPIMMTIASKYDGRVKVAELNAAACPMASARLGVRGTPTVVYFREGAEVERVIGFRGELYHMEIVENELLVEEEGEEAEGNDDQEQPVPR